MTVVMDAVARGNRIDCDEALPFGEGERVRVSVEGIGSALPKRGSAAAVLQAMRQPPHLSSEEVDELERMIIEGKRTSSRGIFDSDN
jgi:hypothetical protein